jgi:hypothetical protein
MLKLSIILTPEGDTNNKQVGFALKWETPPENGSAEEQLMAKALIMVLHKFGQELIDTGAGRGGEDLAKQIIESTGKAKPGDSQDESAVFTLGDLKHLIEENMCDAKDSSPVLAIHGEAKGKPIIITSNIIGAGWMTDYEGRGPALGLRVSVSGNS